MKLSGILFGLLATLSFSFAEVTPLHCGGCSSDKTEQCDDKAECKKDKCDEKAKCKKDECEDGVCPSQKKKKCGECKETPKEA